MKLLSRMTLLFLVLVGCDKKQEFRLSDDFTTLMGNNTSLWKFVETCEDYENLSFFKELYESK